MKAIFVFNMPEGCETCPLENDYYSMCRACGVGTGDHQTKRPESCPLTTAPVGLTPERVAELAQAEDEGLLVKIPCKVGGSVFTVNKVYYPCDVCAEMGRTGLDACYKSNSTPPWKGATYECPEVFKINEHVVEGYQVGRDGVSLAGEWGYEGLEAFVGHDEKQHLTSEAAEAALAAMGEGNHGMD